MSINLDKLRARAEAVASWLCVGLDSDLDRLPPRFRDETSPQWAFNRWIIEQTHPYTAAYKLNAAFYESAGAAGWDAMRQTVAYLRAQHPDILTICDAKRGDIGTTSAHYARSIFDDLGFDAITLSPYLGREALAPFLERADKLNIILCHTSNLGAEEFQGLLANGEPLWQIVARHVSDHWNGHGNCMLVVGATYPDVLRQVRAIVGDMPLLIPGVGAQGGDVSAVVAAAQDSRGGGMLINSSRGIIFSEQPAQAAQELQQAIWAARSD